MSSRVRVDVCACAQGYRVEHGLTGVALSLLGEGDVLDPERTLLPPPPSTHVPRPLALPLGPAPPSSPSPPSLEVPLLDVPVFSHPPCLCSSVLLFLRDFLCTPLPPSESQPPSQPTQDPCIVLCHPRCPCRRHLPAPTRAHGDVASGRGLCPESPVSVQGAGLLLTFVAFGSKEPTADTSSCTKGSPGYRSGRRGLWDPAVRSSLGSAAGLYSACEYKHGELLSVPTVWEKPPCLPTSPTR